MEGPEPQVSTHGEVGATAVEYATKKIESLYRLAPRSIIHATIRLVEESNPANERPAVAEASLDMKGTAIRAHVAAATMVEACDLLEGRLRRQLEGLRGKTIAEGRRPRLTQQHEWRHGDPPSRRPSFFPRPPEEREVLRRKTFAVEAMTPDEAAYDMEILDHDFYLFTNIDTEEENVIARNGDGTYTLFQARAHDLTIDGAAVSIQTSDIVAPETDCDGAIDILVSGNEPFVFFVDGDTGRGNVVYLRYDGNYGLIQPAT
ncbi:MAG: HPF/RaiA family ribosome-associated protein [Actinobacteria bacterium ATB1]|nr:HPF/RaiA family ribosome-associated protein [Actinobacteria bacterium ATB1]